MLGVERVRVLKNDFNILVIEWKSKRKLLRSVHYNLQYEDGEDGYMNTILIGDNEYQQTVKMKLMTTSYFSNSLRRNNLHGADGLKLK